MKIVDRLKYLAKIILQFALVYLIFYLSKNISTLTGLPIPGAIIGMLLLLVLLKLEIIKLAWIQDAANLLLDNMMLFFIPSAVSILVSYKMFEQQLFEIVAVIVISTAITLVVSGIATQKVIEKEENHGGDK